MNNACLAPKIINRPFLYNVKTNLPPEQCECTNKNKYDWLDVSNELLFTCIKTKFEYRTVTLEKTHATIYEMSLKWIKTNR